MASYKRIMLIDDNETDNVINEEIIKSNSFADTIDVFNTGQAALDYLQAHATPELEGKLPEIIFLDINMPIMNGFEFLEEFEKFNLTVTNKCRIIILTASVQSKDIDRAASSKYVKLYLGKPLNIRHLNAIDI
ncbi:response regulator [Runella sp.]|uniref:response regulator n=1 Tax=Runella sp. TaxID=1960881 RepID=UPI003D0C9F4B